MKSTTTPANLTEYVYTHEDKYTKNVWSIDSDLNHDNPEAVIEDYYLYQTMSSTRNDAEGGHFHLEKSFPRHRALMMAAMPCVYRKGYTATATTTNQIRSIEIARARAHDTQAITPFTETTAYQKHHLISRSAMTGLLIERLIPTKKYVESTMKYTHSVLACEFLVGNRYYRNLPQYQQLVGCDAKNRIPLTMDDISPESLDTTKRELLEVYTAQIGRLNDTIKQYKRGFIGINAIRTDPEFIRLMGLYWRYAEQLMKVRRVNDERAHADLFGNNEWYDVYRLFILSSILSMNAMVPELYKYDIAHLFDNARQSFAVFVKASKQTMIRIANDGCTSAFLSFVACEPEVAKCGVIPKHGITHLSSLSMKSCANHIPSRDPLFGELRVKYRKYIPRTADGVKMDWANGCERRETTNYQSTYFPRYEMIENIRAGQPPKCNISTHSKPNRMARVKRTRKN